MTDGWLLLRGRDEAEGESFSLMLETLSDDEAVVAGIGRATGDSVRASDAAGGPRLRFAGYDLESLGGGSP